MNDVQGDRSLLPWHRGCWDSLRRARRAGRFPHALLITGPIGVGKRHLVDLLVRSFLCSHPDADSLPCGSCRDCRLLEAGTHPDRIHVGPDPEGKSDEIKVDAIRRLTEADSLTAHRGGYKVIVVDPAHQMNVNAANSLLKTLEEPAAGTLLCLVSEQPSRLAATIRSRCQSLRLSVPPESDAVDWLRPRLENADNASTLVRLAHGAPLRALDLADDARWKLREASFAGFAAVGRGERDPIAEAAAWNPKEAGILLEWLSDWLSDILRVASGHPAPRLVNHDKGPVLAELAGHVRLRQAHRVLQRTMKARGDGDTTLNVQLMFEALLVEWAGVAGA